jgi:hypothetical protein
MAGLQSSVEISPRMGDVLQQTERLRCHSGPAVPAGTGRRIPTRCLLVQHGWIDPRSCGILRCRVDGVDSACAGHTRANSAESTSAEVTPHLVWACCGAAQHSAALCLSDGARAPD